MPEALWLFHASQNVLEEVVKASARADRHLRWVSIGNARNSWTQDRGLFQNGNGWNRDHSRVVPQFTVLQTVPQRYWRKNRRNNLGRRFRIHPR